MMRNRLPVAICLAWGIIMLLQFFIPHEFVQVTFLEWVNNSTIIVAVFALAIGLASLIHSHSNRIKRRLPGWGFSIVTLAVAAVVTVAGIGKPHWGPVLARQTTVALGAAGATSRIDVIEHTLFGFDPATTPTNLLVHGALLPVRIKSVPLYDWFFNYVYTPLTATTFSLLAFYILTAAFRAMRAKTWEAALLLGAAVIVLLGQVPVDQLVPLGTLDGLPVFEKLKQLILDYPNTAAKRSIIIGVALGSLATGIKILAGIEKPYMGGE